MKFALMILLAASFAAYAADQDYRKLNPQCRSCNELDALATKHNTELSPDNRMEIALKAAKVIEKISVKSKPDIEQKREIYYAINTTIQVLDDDFDSETCVRLLDLRMATPKSFDYVLWRFPLVHQQRIIERMNSFIEDKLRPKAKLPEPKVIEP